MIAPPDEDPNATVVCSSPPCFQHELDVSWLGWNEVRAWRKKQRAMLIARRLSIARDERGHLNEAITARLKPWLTQPDGQRTIGFYWPFKGEYDPRPLMRSLHAQGVRLALPVVTEPAQPLVFRKWWPGIRMVPGIWDIPVPAEGDAVLPDALVVPLVGFDDRGYRLGYGGGYYDRTLAAMPVRPLAIGVGFELSRMGTIHPQPHDIPMSLIVTEQQTIRFDDAAPEAAGLRHDHGR
jgi:5-formyltetrahydrofolate cyclo-ligase